MGQMARVRYPAVAVKGFLLFGTTTRLGLGPTNPLSYPMGTGGKMAMMWTQLLTST